MEEQAGKRHKSEDVSQSTKAAGCRNTPAKHNEVIKLELPRAWEPLDSSKPLDMVRDQAPTVCFLVETRLDNIGFMYHCRELAYPNKLIVKSLTQVAG